jgi:hypothetical protein
VSKGSNLNDLVKAEVKNDGLINSVNKGFYGFGGFLYLVVIGMFFSLCGAFIALSGYLGIMSSEDFKMFTDRNEHTYNFLWTFNFWSVVTYSIGVILFVLINSYLCYKQKKLFRWMMISFYGWSFIGNILFYVVAVLINNDFGHEVIHDVDTLLGTAVYFTGILIIWGTYFLISRRVKNTFIF